MKKRTFSELRFLILSSLLSGQQTTNQLSIKSGINWKTVEAHLTFLIGKGMVREVLKSEYVRIFDLTSDGRKYAAAIIGGGFNIIPAQEPVQFVAEEVIPS
jgi:predicted transcriptional regulator